MFLLLCPPPTYLGMFEHHASRLLNRGVDTGHITSHYWSTTHSVPVWSALAKRLNGWHTFIEHVDAFAVTHHKQMPSIWQYSIGYWLPSIQAYPKSSDRLSAPKQHLSRHHPYLVPSTVTHQHCSSSYTAHVSYPIAAMVSKTVSQPTFNSLGMH